MGWQDVASSTWLGATTSSQAEDTLTAKPPAGHHAHHRAMGQATSPAVAGALFPSLFWDVARAERRERGTKQKASQLSCYLRADITSSQIPMFCFISLVLGAWLTPTLDKTMRGRILLPFTS